MLAQAPVAPESRSVRRRAPLLSAALALAVVAALGAATGRSAVAGPGAPDASSLREFDIGDGRVTFDVTEAPFGQVVAEKIQPKTRVNIFIAPQAMNERVTLRVLDLPWVEALETMTERISGVLVRGKSINSIRVEKPPLVTLDSSNVDINEVIKLIGAGAGDSEPINIVVSPEVTGRVTVSFKKVPWRAALRYVVETAGKFTLVEKEYGVLEVVPAGSLPLDEDTYQFRYLRPPPPYKGVIKTGATGSTSSSSQGGGTGGSSAVGADIVESAVTVPSDDITKLESIFPIVQALKTIVEPDGGHVTYIPGSNAILFTGPAPKIARVRALCDQLDIEPPQVFIDMNFIATSMTDSLNFGMKTDSGVAVGLTGSGITHRLPFAANGDTSGWAQNISGTPFPPPSAASFSYGTLDFTGTNLLFQFLKQDKCAKLVQAPKILALDNQEATIFVGESIRYARSTAASNQNGGLTFSVEEDENSPVNVGFQLLVIPHVIPGENKIMLLVIPQQRALNGTTSPIPGFDRFVVSGQTIDLPRVQSSTLVTTMLLRDRETAVIGGLLEDRDTNGRDKLPILGDLPILGALFQGQARSSIRTNLLITITPAILRGSDAANLVIGDELSGRTERMKAEFHGLGTPAAPCAPPAMRSGPTPPPTPAPLPVAR